MDNPQGLYSAQSPLNRSYYHQGRIRDSQVPLYPLEDTEPHKSNYKPIFLLIIAAIIGYLAYQNSPMYYDKLVRFWREKTKRPVQPSQPKDAIDPLNCEFRQLNFDSGDLDHLKEQMKAQHAQLECSIPYLPTAANQKASVQELLQNPEDLETATGQLAKLNLDDTFEHFNEFIPGVKVFPNSSKEQIQKAADAISQQTDLLKNIEKFNDPSQLTGLALDVNSLYLTLRNLIFKRDKLNKYRNDLIDMAHQLPDCQKDNDVLKLKIATHDAQHGELLKSMANLRDALEGKKQNLNELNQQKTTDKQKLGGEINDLRNKIGYFASKMSNRANIEVQIQSMLNLIDGNSAKIKNYQQTNLQLTADIQNWNTQQNDLITQIAAEKKGIAEMETKFKILELNLQLHYRNKNIKDFLEKMIDTRESAISEFGSIVNEKLEKEDSIKTFIQEFFKNVKALNQGGDDSAVVVELDNLIKEDKEELENFASKYISMVKIIREYKDTDIQINLLLKRQGEIKSNVESANDRIKKMLGTINELEYKIVEGENTRDRHEKTISTLGEQNTKTQGLIDTIRADLTTTQSSLEALQNEFENKEAEAKVD